MEMKKITYSERGLVDSLIYSLDEELTADLLSKAFPSYKGKKFTDIVFYLEQSLSEFGSPDLIISFTCDEKKTIIFVEAKVSNQKNWSLMQQYKLYKKNADSNFFWQIALKQLLIDNRDKNISELADKGVKSENEHIMHKSHNRKLGKNPVVSNLYNQVIKNANEVLYLGIIPKKEALVFDGEDKALFEQIHYLTWKEIEEFANENGLKDLTENFNWNKGLIYND